MTKEEFEAVLTNESNPSLHYWSNLLNWFERHKETLSLSQINRLAAESERCREYWNSTKTVTHRFNKNGKPHELELQKPGLDILKEDVYPNIHQHLDKIRTEDTEDYYEEQNDPSRSEPALIPFPGNDVAMAIAAKSK